MAVARHPRPKELEDMPVEEIMKKFVGRYSEKRADWAAFEDAKIEGFKRAQHRFIYLPLWSAKAEPAAKRIANEIFLKDGSAFLKKKGKMTYRWRCNTCGHKFTGPYMTDVN